MQKTNLILRFNDGVVDGFATREDLIEWFKREGVGDLILVAKEKEVMDSKEEVGRYSIEDGVNFLVELGLSGGCAYCLNAELSEMGDDYAEIGAYKACVCVREIEIEKRTLTPGGSEWNKCV